MIRSPPRRKRAYSGDSLDERPSKRYITGTELIPYSAPLPGVGSYARPTYPAYKKRQGIPYAPRQPVQYGRPYARGNAVVNRASPELKYIERTEGHFPVTFGNDAAGTFSYSGTNQQNYWTAWNGTFHTGYIACLNIVDTGAAADQRIGRKINLKSVVAKVDWRIKNVAASTTPIEPVEIRTMLVWDKNPNGAYPSISDILQPVIVTPTTLDGDNNPILKPAPSSPNNLDNRDRFRTLWDQNDSLSPGGDSIRQYDKYMKLSGETIFSGSTDYNISMIKTGALYIVLLSDGYDDVSMNESNVRKRPLCKYNVRVRYTDS